MKTTMHVSVSSRTEDTESSTSREKGLSIPYVLRLEGNNKCQLEYQVKHERPSEQVYLIVNQKDKHRYRYVVLLYNVYFVA